MAKLVLASAAVLLLGLGVVAGPANAGTPADKGVAAYQSRDYGVALTSLQQAKQMMPNDARVHYYLALTCQALNRTSEAAREYQWIIDKSKNADLKAKANAGLQSLAARPRALARSVRAGSSAQASADVPAGWIKPGGGSGKVEHVAPASTRESFVRGCFK